MNKNQNSANKNHICFGFGANSHGQLGNQTKDDTYQATPIQVFNNGESVVDSLRFASFSIGGGHTLLLSEDGDVYSSGWNEDFQLGRQPIQGNLQVTHQNQICNIQNTGEEDNDNSSNHNIQDKECKKSPRVDKLTTSDQTVFDRITLPIRRKIASVSAGWSHSILISETGEAFSFGSNGCGQCGFDKTISKISLPEKIQGDLPSFKAASCGLKHSLLLAMNGEVFAMGHSKFGALGLPLEKDVCFPQKIPNLENIVAVSAGWKHSLCASSSQAFSFGMSRFGALGLGANVTQAKTPTVCFSSSANLSSNQSDQIDAVYCGSMSSLIVTQRKALFVFGRNQLGQLGLGNRSSQFHPVQLSFSSPGQIIDVKYGNEHCLILIENQEKAQSNVVYGFGWNEHCNLAVEDSTDILAPTEIIQLSHLNVTSVFVGSASSFVICQNNN